MDMTTRATTWAAQIAVMLALVLTSTASASSGLLVGNSPRGEKSPERRLQWAWASVSAETHRGCGSAWPRGAAGSFVAPGAGGVPRVGTRAGVNEVEISRLNPVTCVANWAGGEQLRVALSACGANFRRNFLKRFVGDCVKKWADAAHSYSTSFDCLQLFQQMDR